MVKQRLDVFLTEKGFSDSRSKAQSMIKAGTVCVNGVPETKPGVLVSEASEITIVGEACPYVSRGGLKLEKALRDFGVDPSGLVCSDSGASTGGFTDCLLQNGAKKVFAIDVGTNQLVDKIRNDSRVVVMEQTNIRNVTKQDIGELLDLSVVDVSFISLKLVLPVIAELLKDGGEILCLIKPQFEAGKDRVGKKGVVKDKQTHKSVLTDFLIYTASFGLGVLGLTYSPVTGPEGNIEFLGHLIKGPGTLVPDVSCIVEEAHRKFRG